MTDFLSPPSDLRLSGDFNELDNERVGVRMERLAGRFSPGQCGPISVERYQYGTKAIIAAVSPVLIVGAKSADPILSVRVYFPWFFCQLIEPLLLSSSFLVS